MRVSSRGFLRVAIPVALAAALLAVWRVSPPELEASLFGLMGRAEERIPSFVRENSSSKITILVSSPDADSALSVAAKLGESPSFKADLAGALDFIRPHRSGLVSRETRSLLATPQGRETIFRRAVRRLYSSPVPPLLGFEDDPFFLTDSFLVSLSTPRDNVTVTAVGYPLLATNGLFCAAAVRVLPKATQESLDGTLQAVAALREEARAFERDGIRVALAGAPVHTAVSAERSKTEISVLSWFSLLFIAFLAVVVFRSWRFLPLLALSLGVSALAGALVLFLVFPQIHILACVMGTTVLGLVIDYSFHWLLADESEKPRVRKNLFVSFLTTEISLVPLMLSGVLLLAQVALFLAVGLFAAFAYVLLCYPVKGASFAGTARVVSLPPAWRTVARCLAVALVCAAMAGLVRARVRTDLTALYRPPNDLLQAERWAASFQPSVAFPSLEERRAVAANVRTLYAERGAALADILSVPSLTPPPQPTEEILDPKGLMEGIFATWTRSALKSLGLSLVVLFLVLLVLCRSRAVRLFLPSCLALLVLAGLLGWRGEPINFFHLLAAFLLLGMGIDYAVFLHTSAASSMRSALSALLTSVAGFGALAFVSFPVIASFGLVLGIGLPLVFVLARLLKPASETESFSPSVEKAASPVGLELLFILYRIFGLRALHLLAAAVGVVAWVCSRSVRRAAGDVRKVVFFTRSLADKLVVMARGPSLPTLRVEDSPDAEAFLRDVRTGAGVFVLSSHVGTIEVLSSLGETTRPFHAWMDFSRTRVFTRFYLRHAARSNVVFHPVSDFGLETFFDACAFLDAGDALLMAGDRGGGVFRFASLLDHPVYFVACLAEKGLSYRVIVRALPREEGAMKAAYDEILSTLRRANPLQDFQWRSPADASSAPPHLRRILV